MAAPWSWRMGERSDWRRLRCRRINRVHDRGADESGLGCRYGGAISNVRRRCTGLERERETDRNHKGTDDCCQHQNSISLPHRPLSFSTNSGPGSLSPRPAIYAGRGRQRRANRPPAAGQSSSVVPHTSAPAKYWHSWRNSRRRRAGLARPAERVFTSCGARPAGGHARLVCCRDGRNLFHC